MAGRQGVSSEPDSGPSRGGVAHQPLIGLAQVATPQGVSNVSYFTFDRFRSVYAASRELGTGPL